MSSLLRKIFFNDKNRKGFSLLEVLLVLAILAVITSAGVGFYANYEKNVEISSTAETLSFDLKQAQSKSMIGQGGFKWGIHFVNAASDYYEIFSTPTDYGDVGKVVVGTSSLPSAISFSDPAAGSSKDIIFSKISGSIPAATSTAIFSNGTTKTISVSTVGSVSIQ